MVIITLIGIIIFFSFWRFTDPRKGGMMQDLKVSRIRALTIFEILAVTLTYLMHILLPKYSLNFNQVIINFGLILFISSIAFAVWAKIAMGKYWNQPIVHDIKRQSKIIQSGPFRFSRNPIYVGVFLCFTGFFIVLKSPLIITLIILAIVIHRAVLTEEKNLEKLFGKEYIEYKNKTPRYLFLK